MKTIPYFTASLACTAKSVQSVLSVCGDSR